MSLRSAAFIAALGSLIAVLMGILNGLATLYAPVAKTLYQGRYSSFLPIVWIICSLSQLVFFVVLSLKLRDDD